MKSLVFILIFACFVQVPSYALTKNFSVKKNEIENKFVTEIYFEVTLESAFQEDERTKIEKKLLDINAPFVITEVDYKNRKLIVKMTRKTPYDDVKYAFDQIGLRAISGLEIIK